MSLELLGASGLSSKYVTLRVLHVDADKLRQKLGGAVGAGAPVALTLVDALPEVALQAALPFVVSKARDEYGVDLEYAITDVPPKAGQTVKSGSFGTGMLAGAGLAGLGWVLWRFLLGGSR